MHFEKDVEVLVGTPDMLPNSIEKKHCNEATAFLERIIDPKLKEGLSTLQISALFCKSRYSDFLIFEVNMHFLMQISIPTYACSDLTGLENGPEREQSEHLGYSLS